MLRPSLLLFLLASALLGLLGCEPESAPPLISVTELTPREAEVGDRLEIAGTGFPQGKAARIIFRGTLHRPGERAVRGAVVEAEGMVTGRAAIEVPYTEAIDAAFCGVGDRRRHTTFEGEVEVSFTAAAPGAPPVTSVLTGVSLDLRPPDESPEMTAERNAEGARTLAALGIHPGEATGERGVPVQSVDAGSRAEEAGILGGDVLLAFAGVRIDKLADVLLPSGTRDVEVALRRGAAAREEKRTVRTLGIDAALPADVFGAAFVFAVAGLLLLLFLLPSRGPLVWLERRFARPPRDVPPQGERVDRLAVAAVASFVFALLPMVQQPLIAELDAPTLELVLLVSLATVALMTGRARLRALLAVVTFELPVMIALVGAVSIAGALRLRDIVSAQGGLPWEWSAFRSPPSFLLFLALLAAAMKERIAPLGAKAASDRAASRTLAAAEQLHLYLLSGLSAAVFLGGWTLPWLAPGAESASAPYAALASAAFVAKIHLLVQIVLRGRRAMNGVEVPVLVATFWRRIIPLAALSLGACLMWGRLGLHPEVEALVAVLDVVLLALLAGRLVLRMRRPEPELRLNPFL